MENNIGAVPHYELEVHLTQNPENVGSWPINTASNQWPSEQGGLQPHWTQSGNYRPYFGVLRRTTNPPTERSYDMVYDFSSARVRYYPMASKCFVGRSLRANQYVPNYVSDSHRQPFEILSAPTISTQEKLRHCPECVVMATKREQIFQRDRDEMEALQKQLTELRKENQACKRYCDEMETLREHLTELRQENHACKCMLAFQTPAIWHSL